MECRIGDGDDFGFGEGFAEVGYFGSDDGDVEGGARFDYFEVLHEFVVDDVVGGEVVGGGSDAGYYGSEFVLVVDVAFLFQNFIDMCGSVGKVGEVHFDGLGAVVGVFDVADDGAFFVFEVEGGHEFSVVVERVFAGGAAGVGY